MLSSEKTLFDVSATWSPARDRMIKRSSSINCELDDTAAEGATVIGSERRDAVLRELRLRGTLSVADFARRLDISAVTLRRDLRDLEGEGQLTRVHGGATRVQPLSEAELPRSRSSQQLAATFGLSPRRSGEEPPVATIGMIAPTRGYYYSETINGAKDAARLAGVRLMLAISDYNEAEELHIFNRMLTLGLDGLLITPSKSEFSDSPLRACIEESPIPVTVLERIWEYPTRGRVVDSVRSDHRHGAEIAVAHLAELGHRHLALWTFDNPHVSEIRSGFQAAAGKFGCHVHRPTFDYGHPDWDSVDSLRNVQRYLSEAIESGVTALLVHPDQLALQVVQTAFETGLDIPGSLSVVAYDDEIASLGETRLTAVAPPKRAIGFAAIDACLRSIAHANATGDGFPAQRTRLLPVLRVRESTAPFSA